MIEPLLKPAQVAQVLGVSRSLAYQLIQKGEIPSVRIGRSVRVQPQALEEYIRVHQTGEALINPVSHLSSRH